MEVDVGRYKSKKGRKIKGDGIEKPGNLSKGAGERASGSNDF